MLTTQTPPVAVVSPASGKIERLFYQNGEEVATESQLAFLENSVTPLTVETLEQFFINFESIEHIPNYLNLHFPAHLELGNLHNSVIAFDQKFTEFKNTLKQYLVFKKMDATQEEIEKIEKLNQILLREKQLFLQELELKENNLDRQR